MDFWSTYRLVYAKRWLIAAMALVAAGVILLGTALAARTRKFQAEAILQPQRLDLPAVVEGANGNPSGGGANNADPNAETVSNVSDLIMLLRSSNDLYLRTAALLRADEKTRSERVQRILEKNGYFAPVDADIEAQARQLTERKELATGDASRKWIADNKRASRERIVAQLAHGRDDSGSFAAAGVPLGDSQILARIRKQLDFDTVAGPLSTETAPQIVNQLRVLGTFDREAEANLYVNLLCVAFMDFYTDQRSSANNARLALLREKLADAKARLADARRAEVDYRRKSGVSLTTAAGATLGQASGIETRRNEAEADYRSADAAIPQLETALREAQASRTVALPTEENPAVQRARDRVAAAKIGFDRVNATNLGVRSDEYQSAQAELRAAQAELAAAQSRPYTVTSVSQSAEALRAKLNDLRASRDAARQRLAVLDQQLAQQRATLAGLPAAQARLADLTREVAISENNVKDLETALSKQETFNIETGRAGTINIVSQAHALPQAEGVAAQRIKLLAYGIVLALVFGVAMVVGLDALDNTVKTPQDVEKLTGLPVAGIIPAHLDDPVRAPRLALLEPMSPAAEAYRLLRTDLLFTHQEKPFQSLMLATGKPGQGATTTICNLAIVLAQTGRSVILVDADLRSPKLHRIFGTPNAIGLSTVLAGRAPVDDALASTGIDNLTLLPSGYIPMNPSELLSSLRMRRLHDELKERADFVLFDTPSAIAFSDGPVLASFVDSTLMVVRSANVPRGSEDQVRALLDRARANIIGVVLNGVPAQEVDSVHYHYHYYPVLPPASGDGRGGDGMGYSGGGANGSGGNGANGSGGAGLPIALPGVATARNAPPPPPASDLGGASSPAERFGGADAGTTAVTLEMASGTLTSPYDDEPTPFTDGASAARAAAAFGAGAPPPRAPERAGVSWRTAALVAAVGALVGALVLLLSGGSAIR